MNLKSIAAAVLSLLAVGASNATTTALGPVSIGAPLAFGGFAAPGPFLDIFTFTLPANSGSGYTVSNFTFLPAQFNTVFTNFNLVSNADGIIGNADDHVVASATSAGAANMSLTFAANAGGNYYLSVIGLTNGTSGGVYNGAISVSAVPEPQTYALMLAGVGMVGFLAFRRSRNRDRD
jgi:hypothetical protein